MSSSKDDLPRVPRAKRLSWIAGGGLVAAVFAGAAYGAATPTLSVSQTCITPGDNAAVAGSGFSPNGPVELVLGVDGAHAHNSAPFATVKADSTGALPAGIGLSIAHLTSKRDLEETLTLTANDQRLIQAGTPIGPQTTAKVQVITTTPDFRVRAWDANHFNPRQKTTFTARGLGSGVKPEPDLYIAYALHGRIVKRVRLGALKGPCGNLRRTMRQFPFRPVAAGSYSIYLAPTKASKPDQQLLVYSQIRVSKAKAVR